MHRLRTQLLLSHLLLVLLMGLVMCGAIVAFFSLGSSIDQVLADNFPTVLAAQDLQSALQAEETSFVLLEAGDLANAPILFQSASNRVDSAYSLVQELASEPDELAIVAEMTPLLTSHQRLAHGVFQANSLTVQPGLDDLIRDRLRPSTERLQALAEDMLTINKRTILRENQHAKDQADTVSWRSIIITGVTLILAILLAFRLIRVALEPLQVIADYAGRIAAGEFDQRLDLQQADEVGALGNALDQMATRLDEARRTEARRMARVERMSDVALDSLYDPVIVTNASGRIVHLNRAADGLFGAIPEGIKPPLEEHIRDRRIRKAVAQAIENQTSAEEGERSMIPIKVHDNERTYRLRANPMRDDDGKVLGSVTVLEDITYLRVVDRMKNEFIGVASHELRTPVTSLLLAVQLLDEEALGPLNESQRQVVAAQKQDLERLEKLMRDLLDVTRLEAGTVAARFEMVEPQEIVKNVLHTIRPQAEKKGVELVSDVPIDLPKVYADRLQVGRVLTNLLANAIRHTSPKGVVKVLASASNNHVTFMIEDNGEGIPAEYLQRIFERFVQVPGATQGGAGLGLSIARNIVKAHGGDMTVESEVGKGSKFRFTIPTTASTGEETNA